MKSNMSEVICPNCGHTYKGHTNFCGKVCIYCSFFIPPDKKSSSDFVARIKGQRRQQKEQELKERVFKSILKRELKEKML